MSKNTGGPAFPTREDGYLETGMTLRDYFAAKAMQGIMVMIAGGKHKVPAETAMAEVSKQAYQQADAMLSAREGE